MQKLKPHQLWLNFLRRSVTRRASSSPSPSSSSSSPVFNLSSFDRLSTSTSERRRKLSSRTSFEKYFPFQKEISSAGFNDYDEAKRNFNLQLPEFFNFADDVIDHWAKQERVSDIRRGLPAFWWVSDCSGVEEVKWTFQDLSERSKRVTNILTGPCALKPGDRLMVMLPKIPEWWLINIACIRAGVVVIPATVQLSAKDIKLRVERAAVKCIIADDNTAEGVDQVIANCPKVEKRIYVGEKRPGWENFKDLYLHSSNAYKPTIRTRSADPMMIFFTSGTTGHPKMAEHSHASYGLGHKLTATYGLDLVPTDILWNLSDTGWAKSAWSSIFAPWLNGACVFIHSAAKFDPQFTLKILESYPITTFCAPPTAFRYIVKENLHSYSMKTLRHCGAGGEPLNSEVIEQWFDGTKNIIHEIYGQTETVLTCTSPRCLPIKKGSVGKAVPGMDVTIVDDNGNEVGTNVIGEIAIRVKPHRPIGLFTRYADDPEKTASVFKGDFFVTGDLASVDEEGYFSFSSRRDDVIISAGYRIGPHEVESALINHPAVSESAVVSSPDQMRGEIVKAFVVLDAKYGDKNREELTTDIQNHVKNTTAPYKYPRKVEFVESLPKTISGKIRRSELRAREWKTK